MTEARRITSADGEDLVQLPHAAYRALIDDIDLLLSGRAADRIASGAETPIDAGDVETYLAATTPLAFWRAKRGVAIETLAERAGLTAGALARLEQGTDPLDVDVARRLARGLGIATDDLARG